MKTALFVYLFTVLGCTAATVDAASCPPSVTLTATDILFCPLIRCITPTAPCTKTTSTVHVPCVCQTKPPSTTSLKPSCPTNGCPCPTGTVTKSASCSITAAPTTTSAPCDDCPVSKTVSTGFPICPLYRCASPTVACPQLIRLVDVPCCCQKKPPTTTTVPAQCPPNGCSCVIPTITSTEECAVATPY